MNRAPFCSLPACSNRTRSRSGRCHHHDGGASRIPAYVPPPPSLEQRVAAWRRGKHEDHPVGGYDEVIQTEETTSYFRRALRHRTDGPAKIVKRKGLVIVEEWYIRGALDRADGPASVMYRNDGGVFEERWMRDDFHHREDGPAVVRYSPTGEVTSEDYRLHGRYSRLDGPAVREFRPGSKVWEERFFVTGEEFTAEEFARLREALDADSPFEWARSYAKGESA